MVHANNSVTSVPAMAGGDGCSLTALVFGELRKLGVKVSKVKKFRTRTKQPSGCRPGAREQGCIFGAPLEDQDVVVSEETGIPVPWFLKVTTEFLLENKCCDGLFRKTGSVSRQRELRRTLENGGNLKGAQVHDVAVILKQWFRELPETVVPKSLNELILRCMLLQSTELHVQAFQLVCLLLPPEHLHVLQHTLLFLSMVAQESGANRMDAHNLAVVMAPNLLTSRCEAMPPKKASEQLQSQTLFVELMIENATRVGQLPGTVKNISANTSDEELEQSGDELSQGQPKTRKQRILSMKLRLAVPRSRDAPTAPQGNTPLHPMPREVCNQRASTIDLIAMECSPRLPTASKPAIRSDLKRRASVASPGQRDGKADSPILGPSPRKKARSPLTTTQELALCSVDASGTEGLRRSKRSVTSVVSVDPLMPESPGGLRTKTAPIRHHSTRSLRSVPARANESELAGDCARPGTPIERGVRRSVTFYTGCRVIATPVRRVPTPGTVKSRSTLKRGRPNTVYTGLPSPFKPPDTFTPQISRKASRSIQFINHDAKNLSGSTFSLADMDELEGEVFGNSEDLPGNMVVKKCLSSVESNTKDSSVNLNRQSSYTAVYDATVSGEGANEVQSICDSVCFENVSADVNDGGVQKSLTTLATNKDTVLQAAENPDSATKSTVRPQSPAVAVPGPPSSSENKAGEVSRRSSLESSFSVSSLRISDSTPTLPQETNGRHKNTLGNREKEERCDSQIEIHFERWATPLPVSTNDVDDSGSRRESIVQIRKRNAGMVRQNVRLFSQNCDSAVFVTPKRPPVRKAASVNAGSMFVRNVQGTRSLRSNTSSSCLQRSPLQQANRMDVRKTVSVTRKPSIKACNGTKEWVMEV